MIIARAYGLTVALTPVYILTELTFSNVNVKMQCQNVHGFELIIIGKVIGYSKKSFGLHHFY